MQLDSLSHSSWRKRTVSHWTASAARSVEYIAIAALVWREMGATIIGYLG